MRFAIYVLACALASCAAPVDESVGETESTIWSGEGEDPDGEVIEIEGDAPFDPNWEGPGEGAPGNHGEPSGGGGGGGYGGGEPNGSGGTGGPGDEPERKECYPEMGEEKCLECCLYNYDHVDGWRCRKLKKKAKENCWAEAAQKLADCQVETCNRHGLPPIVTVAP